MAPAYCPSSTLPTTTRTVSGRVGERAAGGWASGQLYWRVDGCGAIIALDCIAGIPLVDHCAFSRQLIPHFLLFFLLMRLFLNLLRQGLIGLEDIILHGLEGI